MDFKDAFYGIGCFNGTFSLHVKPDSKRYSNIEREALGILHGLEKFHHYYFAKKVSIITNHKLLMIIFKKDVATLSQRLQ